MAARNSRVPSSRFRSWHGACSDDALLTSMWVAEGQFVPVGEAMLFAVLGASFRLENSKDWHNGSPNSVTR